MAAAQAERVTENSEKNAAAEEQDEDVSHNTMVSALACYCVLCVRHVISFDTLALEVRKGETNFDGAVFGN
jgi:hypothetical protein